MKRYHKAILISIGLILFLAFLDISGFKMWSVLGGFQGEAYTKAMPQYMDFFWNFSYGLIALLAICYYSFYKKDLSEVAAIVSSFFILLWFGLEDIFYYILRGIPLDSRLPWLDEHLIMGKWAEIIGQPGVTNVSLISGVFVGLIASYYLSKYFKEQKW